MGYGITNFGQVGDADQPSPSVWGDCAKTELPDLGLGFFIRKDFDGSDATLPGVPTDSSAGSTFTYNTSNDTAVDIAVTNTDNFSASIFTQPLGQLQKGKKLWAEVRVALAALTDQSVFFGFAALAALTKSVLANDPSNAAQAGLSGNSLFGFVTQQVASATTKFDAVYRKAAGTVVTVLADVTNATALASADRANLVANTFVKLGVRWDGRDKLRFYVNGVQVAAQILDTTLDQTSSYGAILSLKTGAAAARTITADFFRAGSQVRS